MNNQAISLYIHIPFCETKCPYCDFNTYAGIEGMIPDYVKSLVGEITLWGQRLGRPSVSTIFFGGGTPSYIPAKDMAKILKACHSSFHVTHDAEITLEANPGDLTREKAVSYLEEGINRISIGVQSLGDALLRLLGRRHTAEEAVRAYHLAREAGFSNVNLDFMYGMPYQDLETWRQTLEQSLALEPDHLSLYCLTLEEGTPMHRLVRNGQLPEPDPDLAADMYQMAEERLEMAGYRHYEISNWARPGFESRHNLTYWRNGSYLGVGPGAHSFLDGFRFYNLKSPREYIQRLKGHANSKVLGERTIDEETLRSFPTVQDVEEIDTRLEMAETMMMGLRLDEGITLEAFAERFERDLLEIYQGPVEELTSLGLLALEDGALILTPRGRLLGNEVFSRFLAS